MSTPLYLGDKDSPKYAPIMKFSTLIKLSLSAAALLCSAASAQATVVSWDGTSTDITSLSSNVNVSSSGGSVWVASNGIWDTTDLTFAAIGSQAALQVAYSQIQQTHKTIQINHGGNALLAAGGGSSSQGKIDVTAGFSTVYAFDTSTFSASEVLANMSVTVHERTTSDVCSFRWFVVAGGTTYVSASVAADVGGTLTEYTLADAASETWYAFDGSVNIESAVGASVGTLSLTNVTYAGIMATVDTLGSASNWRGLYVDKFSAEATSPPTTVQTNAVYADVTGAAAFTSATDLANQGQATFASSTVSANQDPGTPEDGFNDGVTESNKGSMTWFRDDVQPTQFPGEIVLNLDVSTNSAGYNITTINSIAGYNIGGAQADQVMTVEYSVVGDTSYTTLGTYSNEAADTQGQYSSISLADYLNGNLATGVDSLRFTYANPAANTRLALQEIDVIGGAVQATNYESDLASVQAATSAADLVDSSQATYASSTITANQGGDTAATEDVNDGVTATDLNNATWFRDDQTPAQFPAEVVLNLDVTTNTNGYNISEINSIAGWNNAQHDQVMTVEYSIVGSADWVSIGQFTNIPSTASYSRIHLSSSPAGYLANSVDALRFTYADPDLAATGHRIVLQEIDVIGAPAGAFPPTLTVDALSNDMLIEPSQATTVTGTSTAGAGITVAFSGQSKTTTAAGDGSWSVSLDAEVANSTGQVLTVTANLNSLTTVASYTNVVVGYQPIDLQLSSMFSDDMILQREKAVPVWGTSSASAGITVEFDGQTKTTTAAGDGTWTVSLDSMVASITSRVLTVTASLNGGTTVLTYNNVLVGEVWLCSGQSNMAWQNNQSDHQATVEATPNNPTLRFYKVPLLSQGTPVAHINTVWTESTTGSSGTATAFSAVAYFFGLKLQDELESSEGADVPIGLIQSAKGGSQIETWMPAGTVYNSGAAGGYYNGQIDALIPFAMRGVIWYQGEANLSDGMAYVPKQKALIDGWRALWLEDFPFYYVQLAPRSGPGETKPIFWEAQSAVLDQVAGTGMAVITDTWNGTEGIHPGNKQPVGERLGLLALDNTYGQDIVSTGPTFQSIRLSGSTLEVTFDSAVGLTPASPDYFEIAGADGTYVAATATVSGNKLVLSNAAVALPVSMRFAWIDTAQPNLRNAAGLVPSAFRATSPRGTWLAANSLTDSDWENNADGDGNSNLLEFAFGTDPAVSNNNSIGYGSGVTPGLPLPVLETITSNNVDFRAVFGRRKNWSVAGLSYTPQFSPDLTEWVDVTTTPTLIESGSGDIDAVFVPYPMIIQTTTGWEKPQFFRLSVSQD